MKIYICSPRTGLAQQLDNINMASDQLERAGHEPVFDGVMDCDEGFDWVSNMKVRLGLLLTCDALAMLPGFNTDTGSVIEYQVAKSLKYRCDQIDHWTVEALTRDMVAPLREPQLPQDRWPTSKEWRDWFVRSQYDRQIDIAEKVLKFMAVLDRMTKERNG